VPLADEGVTQAQITARRLAAEPLAAVYSSPLQRAARTAQIIAEPHGLVARTLPGLGSMNYGDWAGRPHAEVARQWLDLYRQWRYDPYSIQIPGGETTADLRKRAIAAVDEALARHVNGETLVLVSHQVVAKTLTCALAACPPPPIGMSAKICATSAALTMIRPAPHLPSWASTTPAT